MYRITLALLLFSSPALAAQLECRVIGVADGDTVDGCIEKYRDFFADFNEPKARDLVGFLGVAMSAPLAWFGALIPLVPAWWFQRRRLRRLVADGEAQVAPVLAAADV